MIVYNAKAFISAILIIAFIVFFSILWFIENSNNIVTIVWTIFKTITLVSILSFIFINYAWKWKIFYPWLTPFPNLSGTWIGEMKSNYEKDGEGIPPIPFEIKINQNFFNIQVELKTKESLSRSVSASFDIEKQRGLNRIIYTYQNDPKNEVRERSQIHNGTTILNFETGFNVTKLEGIYFTDRGTAGDITLEKINKIGNP